MNQTFTLTAPASVGQFESRRGNSYIVSTAGTITVPTSDLGDALNAGFTVFSKIPLVPPSNNSIAFVGDSRLAQMFNDGGIAPYYYNPVLFPGVPMPRVLNQHWFTVANALMGQRMRIVCNNAVSGQTSTQYLPRLGQAIASNPAWIMIFGVTNDISQYVANSDTISTIWARIKGAALATIAAGINVILPTESGGTGLSGNATMMGMVWQYNELVREFCEITTGAYCWDYAGVLVSPTGSSSSAIAFNTNYSADGTHPDGYGSWYLGVSLAAFLSPLVPPSNPIQNFSLNEVAANGNIQQFPNPLFNTLTGGIAVGSITGNVPSGLTITASGSSSLVITSASDSGGFGNDITLAATFTTQGEHISCVTTAQGVGNYTIPGDYVQAGVEASLAAGSSNLQSFYCNVITYGDGSNYPNSSSPFSGTTSTLALPPVAMDLQLATVPAYFDTGIVATGWTFYMYAAAAGSATITLKRPWLRRRYSY